MPLFTNEWNTNGATVYNNNTGTVNIVTTLTVSPTITVPGAGNLALFQQDQDGITTISVRNDSTGTASIARILVRDGNNSFSAEAMSSTFVGTGARQANATLFQGNGPAGISFASFNVIRFYTGGNGLAQLAGTWDTTFNFKLAGTAVRGTTEGTNHLDIFDGTAPVGTLANGISLYSTAGELRVMDSAGNATLLSPHEKGTNNWIYDSVDTTTGKHLRIDMERMLKFLNKKFGTDFIKEFYD